METVKWSLTVSKETDKNLQRYLAQQGLTAKNLSSLVEKAVTSYIKHQNKLSTFDFPSFSVEEVQAQGLAAFAKPVSFETIVSESDPIPDQSEAEILAMIRQIRKESNIETRMERIAEDNGHTT